MSVRALSQQTRLGSRDLQDYGRVFDGRLDALARTQDLLLKGSDAIPLDALLRLELTAAGAREGTTFTLDGPAVMLTAQAAQAMAMTVHELTTNAAKYGALSVENGHIAIRWRSERRESETHLRFGWRDHGVALRQQPTQKGFGTEIIERSLPYVFGGSSVLTFHSDGAECIVEFPLPTE